ncbi:MAG: outer membrane beta-barrel protein [Xanthobacteraceae bacterium]|jgi:outer membrane immunogenic protein
MKRLVLAAAVLTAFTSASHAGGSAVGEYDGTPIPPDFFTAPPGMSPARPYNWTGAYIGLNAGGGGGHTSWVSTPDGTTGSSGMSGGFFGGTLGYNLQAGNSPFVLGEEVDLARTSLRGRIPTIVGPIVSSNTGLVTGFGPVSCTPNCELSVPWLATARLRFGYSVDRVSPYFTAVMPYFTAGVSIARLEAGIVGTPLGTQSKNNLSWTVGGGVEFVISDRWTAKLEYLHVDLDGFSCDTSCGANTVSMNTRENIFRAGLNFRMWNH